MICQLVVDDAAWYRRRTMCGFVGIVASTEVAPEIHMALQALQHRGQDSAGIATMRGDGQEFFAHRGLGQVPHC